MNSEGVFNKLMRQHDMIREVTKGTQAFLETIKTSANEGDFIELIGKLEHLRFLLLDHSGFEEAVLIPVLKKMYHPQEELAHYVKDEHIVLDKDLKALIQIVKDHVEQKKGELDREDFFKIRNYLQQTVTHLVEEEVSLFPMLKVISGQI